MGGCHTRRNTGRAEEQATEDLLVCLYAGLNLDTILLIGGAISLSLITILTTYKYSRDGFD